MLILSLLVNILIAQQVVKSPLISNAQYIESGTFSVTSTGSTTVTFKQAQPDTKYKVLLYVQEFSVQNTSSSVRCWTDNPTLQKSTYLYIDSQVVNVVNAYILRYLIVSSLATNIYPVILGVGNYNISQGNTWSIIGIMTTNFKP